MLELGQMRITAEPATVYVVENIGAGVIVAMYDKIARVGGMACIVLPDSKMDVAVANGGESNATPAKYADLAIPRLIDEFSQLGGNKQSSIVRIVGGAQLFNFGGGGSNLLNIGVRNAAAIRAALSRHGFAIEKAETGGNKTRSVRLVLANGQMFVRPVGSDEFSI